MTLKDDLEAVLTNLNSVGGIKLSAIISRQGLLMVSKATQGSDSEVFAALTATLHMSAESTTKRLSKEMPKSIVVETEEHNLITYSAGPNAIAIPVKIWRTLRRHPAIRSLMKEPDSRQLTEDGFPRRLFGLNASFPGARQNTVMPGATESLARVWGNNIWLGVVNPRPALRSMSFAYTLRADGQKVETYEDKKRKSDVLRIQHQISSEKITCNTAGYLIGGVLA